MMFFKKKQPYDHPPSSRGNILYEKGGKREFVSIQEFEQISGVSFIPQLDFSDWDSFYKISSRISKLQTKGKLAREQLWLGSYFQKEIATPSIPEVSIRWIDDEIGWGVFAEKDFKKMDYITEYSGLLRKARRSDHKNGYCFQYLYAPGIPSKYTIDAEQQGGVSRFMNHSSKPNLDGHIATLSGLNHIVLFPKAPIAKGTQLTYDYGPSYWSKRESPRVL